MRPGEEEAGKIAQEYRQAGAQQEREYAETAAALAEKQELSAREAVEVSQLWRKLVGDWHLLKSHEEYETMLERAERMPACFGMSAAFMGEEESAGGRRLARCEELIAFDCVAQPAAMPSGLFAAKNVARVDSQSRGIQTPSKTELTDPNSVPAEMPAWFQPFAKQLTRQGGGGVQCAVFRSQHFHAASDPSIEY